MTSTEPCFWSVISYLVATVILHCTTVVTHTCASRAVGKRGPVREAWLPTRARLARWQGEDAVHAPGSTRVGSALNASGRVQTFVPRLSSASRPGIELRPKVAIRCFLPERRAALQGLWTNYTPLESRQERTRKKRDWAR